MAYPLLDFIESPEDLRCLPSTQLPLLAEQLREYLIDNIAQSGGHFASGLGTIELTIALHYLFNTPEDVIIWDVGHQAYPHKILTGRKQTLQSIRKKGGLHPFPHRQESKYDAFGVGHSSTSISAALGMALAFQAQQQHRYVIAVIGDGAMTAGQAFEALNHAGGINANLLVILNDNEMSISPNVGALSNMLTRTLSNPILQNVRNSGKELLSQLPPAFKFAKATTTHLKNVVSGGGMLFEELGFHYFGPIDGHDLNLLTATLSNLKQLSGPCLLHIMTKKGKGYAYAEKEPILYHGVSPFNRHTGLNNKAAHQLSYTQTFSQWLCYKAGIDPTLVAITPAMREGSGLVEFSQCFPERYFDAAIAEQHAITLAAGFACQGMKPVVAIYSTFLQRGYDQLIHDVALQNLPVIFAIDRAGIVGPDGATHAGSFDLSYLRIIPNLIIMAPANQQDCFSMLNTAHAQNCPVAIRYPRGTGSLSQIDHNDHLFEIGKAAYRLHSQSTQAKVALIGVGAMVDLAEQIGKKYGFTVVDLRFIKPLDDELLTHLCQTHDALISLEDNAIAGGAGSAISEWMSEHNYYLPIKHFGLPDVFPEHGERQEILQHLGLDFASLCTRIEQWCQRHEYLK